MLKVQMFVHGIAVGALGALFVGCSGSSPAPSDKATTAVAPTAAAVPQQPVAIPADAPPDQVVATFLGALRSGDKPTTAALLTTKARAETAKHQLAIDPLSAPNAKYEVLKPEYLTGNPDGAHVASSWSETYEDGTVTYDIVWVLRREAGGWRIAGMASELVPGEPPAFLNFEDPADMIKKWDEALAAETPAEATVTAQPSSNATPPRIER